MYSDAFRVACDIFQVACKIFEIEHCSISFRVACNFVYLNSHFWETVASKMAPDELGQNHVRSYISTYRPENGKLLWIAKLTSKQ